MSRTLTLEVGAEGSWGCRTKVAKSYLVKTNVVDKSRERCGVSGSTVGAIRTLHVVAPCSISRAASISIRNIRLDGVVDDALPSAIYRRGRVYNKLLTHTFTYPAGHEH